MSACSLLVDLCWLSSLARPSVTHAKRAQIGYTISTMKKKVRAHLGYRKRAQIGYEMRCFGRAQMGYALKWEAPVSVITAYTVGKCSLTFLFHQFKGAVKSIVFILFAYTQD